MKISLKAFISTVGILVVIIAAILFTNGEERVVVYESMYAGCICGPGYYHIDNAIVWEMNPNHDSKKMFARIIDNNENGLQYGLWEDGTGFPHEGQGAFFFDNDVLMFDDEEVGKAVTLRASHLARMLNFNDETIQLGNAPEPISPSR